MSSLESLSDDVAKIMLFEIMGYDAILLWRILKDALMPELSFELQFPMEI